MIKHIRLAQLVRASLSNQNELIKAILPSFHIKRFEMASNKWNFITATMKRVIYVSLAAFFISRIYISSMKLRAREVSFSQKIIKEDPQMYPSFSMCAYYFPFFGPDSIIMMSSNLTEWFRAHEVLFDHILDLQHVYEDENR